MSVPNRLSLGSRARPQFRDPLEPANPEFLHALAWHHLKQGDAAKAKPFVERLEAAAPGSEVARQMRQMLGRR
jgi:hypothetical protein